LETYAKTLTGFSYKYDKDGAMTLGRMTLSKRIPSITIKNVTLSTIAKINM